MIATVATIVIHIGHMKAIVESNVTTTVMLLTVYHCIPVSVRCPGSECARILLAINPRVRD